MGVSRCKDWDLEISSLKPCSTSFPGAQTASLSTPNCLQSVLKVSSCRDRGFHLRCVCVGSVAKLCLTLRPGDSRPPGSSVHGIFQARALEWAAMDLPDPGTEPASLALAGRFFTTVPPGKPKLCRGRWKMPFASTKLLLTL